jgi:hypothetical protein
VASTNAAPLGPPSEAWVGRRVNVQLGYGVAQSGMVAECSVTPTGTLTYLVIQPPSGASVYVPGTAVLSVTPDGWAEAVSQANDDFQMGQQ